MEPTTMWDAPADQLRELIDLLVRTGTTPPPAELAPLLQQARDLLAPLARPAAQVLAESEVSEQAAIAIHRSRSMISGGANPLAPPVRRQKVDGSWVATTRLGLAYQGPPGRVHGGMIAAILDHTLGQAQPRDRLRFTRTLTIDYLAATPLYADLVITARPEESEGRKVWMVGEVTVDGTVTARARGLWISPRAPLA